MINPATLVALASLFFLGVYAVVYCAGWCTSSAMRGIDIQQGISHRAVGALAVCAAAIVLTLHFRAILLSSSWLMRLDAEMQMRFIRASAFIPLLPALLVLAVTAILSVRRRFRHGQ